MFRFIVAGALALACLPGSASAQDKDTPAEPRPLKVCFVDLQRVFDSYSKKKELESILNGELELEKKKLQALVDQGKALADELADLDQTTWKAKQIRKQLFLLQRKVAFQKRWVEVDLAERMSKLLGQLYQEILVGVDRFASERGYDIVFQVNKNPLKADSADRLRMLIREKTVLYYRKSLDRTDAVIKLLNSPKAKKTPRKDPPK